MEKPWKSPKTTRFSCVLLRFPLDFRLRWPIFEALKPFAPSDGLKLHHQHPAVVPELPQVHQLPTIGGLEACDPQG